MPTKKTTSKRKNSSPADYFIPGFMMFSRDALRGADKSLTLIRLIDAVFPSKMPARLSSFFMTAEFRLAPGKSAEAVNKHKCMIRISLENPKGKSTDIGEIEGDTLTFGYQNAIRYSLDIAPSLQLEHYGSHVLRLEISFDDSEERFVLSERMFSVEKPKARPK